MLQLNVYTTVKDRESVLFYHYSVHNILFQHSRIEASLESSPNNHEFLHYFIIE